MVVLQFRTAQDERADENLSAVLPRMSRVLQTCGENGKARVTAGISETPQNHLPPWRSPHPDGRGLWRFGFGLAHLRNAEAETFTCVVMKGRTSPVERSNTTPVTKSRDFFSDRKTQITSGFLGDGAIARAAITPALPELALFPDFLVSCLTQFGAPEVSAAAKVHSWHWH
jgi:hypothetical protein